MHRNAVDDVLNALRAILYTLLIIWVTMVIFACMAWAHGPYTHWQTKEGYGCCNDTDCSPADEVKMEDNQLFAKWRGTWYKVPKEDIRPYDSPDGLNHICVAYGRVLCFVWGAGG